MITHKQVEEYLLSMPKAHLDYPFGEGVAVYKAGDKMFALVTEKKQPVQISLKCDPQLAEVLRGRFISVMAGYHLSKKYWNTIVLSGELDWEEIQALIRHSYDLVTKNGGETPQFASG